MSHVTGWPTDPACQRMALQQKSSIKAAGAFDKVEGVPEYSQSKTKKD